MIKVPKKKLYEGMKIRPSMDMIANLIENDPYRMKYPDKNATLYLNSPRFLNLRTDAGVDLDEQNKKIANLRREHLV